MSEVYYASGGNILPDFPGLTFERSALLRRLIMGEIFLGNVDELFLEKTRRLATGLEKR